MLTAHNYKTTTPWIAHMSHIPFRVPGLFSLFENNNYLKIKLFLIANLFIYCSTEEIILVIVFSKKIYWQ